MALNREQAQQKVKEILDLARNEKKTLTYQDVMNKLSDLDIDATRSTRFLRHWNPKALTSSMRRRMKLPFCLLT